jgi:outer membrane protein OmpA-like peptidoglycan-associated protein
MYKDYDEFNCGRCGELLAHNTKHYFGPTKAGVSLIFGIGGKEATPVPVYVAPPPPPVVQAPPPPVYEPTLRAGFVTPEVEAVKARSESGSAYLDFAVGRSEIVTGFRNNAAELQKIYSTIEFVRENPDMTITGISVVGHASPEGTYSSNMQLSERRAEALRRHIRTVYSLADGFITARGEGEDWAGLDSLVATSDMPERYRALEVIRSSDDYDRREASLRALDGGATYRRILAEYYPGLRRSDYRIGYTVVPFTVDKGKEVFRTRPGDLSLNEMFMIANTYAVGGAEFDEVFETAARVFPTSDVANLNAAASAMNRGDAVSAARYLDRVQAKSGEAYWNNAGVLAFLQGDKQRAAECFARSGAQGTANAAELSKHLQSIAARQ